MTFCHDVGDDDNDGRCTRQQYLWLLLFLLSFFIILISTRHQTWLVAHTNSMYSSLALLWKIFILDNKRFIRRDRNIECRYMSDGEKRHRLINSGRWIYENRNTFRVTCGSRGSSIYNEYHFYWAFFFTTKWSTASKLKLPHQRSMVWGWKSLLLWLVMIPRAKAFRRERISGRNQRGYNDFSVCMCINADKYLQYRENNHYEYAKSVVSSPLAQSVRSLCADWCICAFLFIG